MTNPQMCKRCVMDATAKDIVFDENGICNYCTNFLSKMTRAKVRLQNNVILRNDLINKIKSQGKSKQYDCIIGVSGGVDSSYALYLAVKNGLRPLAVHLDNGWNSELASHNISNLVTNLNVDLYTHVINWEENRDLQRSFFKANVVDIEMLMDNAMLALNFRMASEYKVKFILAGNNLATEGITMPEGWNHNKYDARNIRSIHKRYGNLPIKTHPLISTLGRFWYQIIRRIRWVSFLDYFDYNKNKAIKILQEQVGYKPYPYKHYESVFTRFYQGYILPKKFGYDKRKVHLSALIVTGQLSRESAISLLKTPPYPDSLQEEQDKLFVMKKLGFTENEFQDYIKSSEVPHDAYASEEKIYKILIKIYKRLRDGPQKLDSRGR